MFGIELEEDRDIERERELRVVPIKKRRTCRACWHLFVSFFSLTCVHLRFIEQIHTHTQFETLGGFIYIKYVHIYLKSLRQKARKRTRLTDELNEDVQRMLLCSSTLYLVVRVHFTASIEIEMSTHIVAGVRLRYIYIFLFGFVYIHILVWLYIYYMYTWSETD